MARPRKTPRSASFTRAALTAALDQLERMAMVAGAAAERARIAAILNNADAAGRLGFAWQLAQSGLDEQAAIEALTICKLASAFPPVDTGAQLSH